MNYLFEITQIKKLHTLQHCSAKSLLVLENISVITSRLQIAFNAPSIATIRLVHSADTSR